ncbi:hypothetical protein V5O48_013125 [Marasmius crinis-equi]|uniref:Bacteriophage T5 Orf172 DNA-binding domain-containing protein n=1 Tax=Marasmius crinis-equi TaxID=585013 RepID=A0ABR3F0X9_9AGAR
MDGPVAPSFCIDCFSRDDHFTHQSTCVGLSFNDEVLSLWLKEHAAMDRPISGPNGDGYIYVFRIEGVDFSDVTDQDLNDTAVYKVGQSCCPERREREWGRQCPSQKHTWFVPVRVERCHDVERLVHKALEKICVVRPKKKCFDCRQVHQEIFVMENGPDVVNEVIVPLIEEQNRVAKESSGL